MSTIILPLVPCPYPSPWWGEVPHDAVHPLCPGLDGVSLGPDWMVPTGQDWMGYPLARTGWYPLARTGWGIPWPGLDGTHWPGLDGVSLGPDWMVPTGQDWMGYPLARTGWYSLARTGWVSPQPGQDGVPHLPRDRTVDRIRAMRRAVCLLRSRRRTVLFCVVSVIQDTTANVNLH